MVVRQGNLYWLDMGEPAGSEPGYRHPYVVIQNNLFNESRINTVVVCGLTSNLRLAKLPGNVLLRRGEGNLIKESVVNISQVYTVDKRDLEEMIGMLSPRRIRQILAGLQLLLEPREFE